MSYENIAYYIGRVAQENEAAKNSTRAEAVQVHLKLASEYEKLAHGCSLPTIWTDYRSNED